MKQIIAKLRERRMEEVQYAEKEYQKAAANAAAAAQEHVGYAAYVTVTRAYSRTAAPTDWTSHHIAQMRDYYGELAILNRELRLLADVERLYTEATPDADAVTVQDAAAQIIPLVQQKTHALRQLPAFKKHDLQRAELTGCREGLLWALAVLGFTDEQIAPLRGTQTALAAAEREAPDAEAH